MEPQNYHNIHANSLIIDHQGILIYGKSGSGKTSLMLSLLEHARTKNRFAAMVGDDQTLIYNAHNRLIALCPRANEGRFELRGHGIVDDHFIASTIVNLVVEIVPHEEIERMPEQTTKAIIGVKLPLIYVPQFWQRQSIQIILATITGLRNASLC